METNVKDSVTLTWPNLTQVPKSLNLYLQDLETKRRLYMRTQTSYAFSPASDRTPRRFRITAEPRMGSNLLIRNLTIRTSLQRSAPTTSQVTYVLNQAADVQIRLLSVSGRLVNQFSAPSSRAGLNSLGVPHVNPLGFILPRGLYLCEVTATTKEGQSVKAVKGLVAK